MAPVDGGDGGATSDARVIDASSSDGGGERDAAPAPEDGSAPLLDASVVADAGMVLPPTEARPVVVDEDSTFADVAREMARGEWTEYETAAPAGYFRNGEGGHDLTWADSAVWDPTSQCILHYGGGHLVVPALSIYCVSTNEWIRGPLPPWLDLEGSVWGYTNHGYDRNAFDPETRQLFFYRGRELWTFALETETWSSTSLSLGNAYLRDFATFFPGLGVIAGRGENDPRIIHIDPSAGTATLLADSDFHSALHTFAAYSPQHDVMLYGGGDDSTAIYRLARDGTTAPGARAPGVIRTVATGVTGGWTVTDPENGDFLVLFAPTGELHRYDPTADTWRFESRSPFAAGLTRTIAATLDEHGVVLFAHRTGETTARIVLYKP
jgi:hypothetical protein